MRAIQFLILIIILCKMPVMAQRNVDMKKVDKLPLVDGQFADVLDRMTSFKFVQLEPHNGIASNSETKILVLQDDKQLYFAIACYQTDQVIAKIQMRDKFAQSDDGIYLMLGTFNDNRNGFAFGVNPLGAQVDYRIMDDGRTIDYNWDTQWKSSAIITDWGWFSEFTIPFESIKFIKNKNSWQINFKRVIRNASEIAYWSENVKEENKISESGIINNLKLPAKSDIITVIPYGMEKVIYSNTNGHQFKFSPQLGGDMKFQLNSNLAVNATINPDFATIEADEDVIDLSRYEIEYPEKRIFFQEGNEMYDMRFKTFYSRRIGDIAAAAKVNGKIGKNNINFISALDKYEISKDGGRPLYNSIRLKHDFLKSSSLGFTATSKSWTDTMNTTFSGDYVLNLGKLWKLTGQYVAVVDNWKSVKNAAYLRFAVENNFFHWHLRTAYLDGNGLKNTFNQTGYLKDDDRNEYDSDYWYKWWLSNHTFKFIRLTTKNNWYWNHDYSKFLSWNLNEIAEFYFTNKLNIDLKYNNEYRYVLAEQTNYYNYFYEAALGFNTEAYNRVMIKGQIGRSFSSDYLSIEAPMRLKVFSKLSLEFNPKYIQFSPETKNYKSAFISQLLGTYNFTNDLWIRLVCQNNTSNNKFYIYGLAAWRFKPPFGTLYFIVNHTEVYEKNNVFRDEYVGYLKLSFPINFN